MSKKMSVMGIGHKAGAVVFVYLAATFAISYFTDPFFRITDSYGALLTVGIVLAAVGFSANLVAAVQMLRAHKADRLATGGLYRVFLNPMYFLMMFVTLPGVTLLFNSWLVLTTIPVGAVAVHLFAREEGRYLEERYGEAYRAYHRSVPVKF
jgi:protein-S-isoprenylcysteine O-methyltransferase Ste14